MFLTANKVYICINQRAACLQALPMRR